MRSRDRINNHEGHCDIERGACYAPAAAGRCRPNLRLARGRAAPRDARTRSRSTTAWVWTNGSARTRPLCSDSAAAATPSTSAISTSPSRGCWESSAARRMSVVRSSGYAIRIRTSCEIASGRQRWWVTAGTSQLCVAKSIMSSADFLSDLRKLRSTNARPSASLSCCANCTPGERSPPLPRRSHTRQVPLANNWLDYSARPACR